MQDNITQIAAIFARGVCRFRQRKQKISEQENREKIPHIPLNQFDIITENRPCVHSKKTVQRRISSE